MGEATGSDPGVATLTTAAVPTAAVPTAAVPTAASATAGLGDLVICVDHVGLAVPDLDAAVAWHTEILGFRVGHRETNLEQQVEEVMLVASGSGAHGAQLQLLAPTGPQSTIAAFLDRRGPGLQQLAIRVRDINLACDVLRMKNMRLLYDSPRRGTGGSRINFIHPKDAGGVLIELVEPPGAHSDGDAEDGVQRSVEKGNPS